jgi:hypothetical protein
MKRAFFSTVSVLLLTALFYWAFSFNASNIVSKPSKEGTIEVCWAEYCKTAPETTVIELVDEYGKTVGTCTISPPGSCCKITGDFPSGAYSIVYYRPTGVSKCKTDVFRYENGTDVTMKVICRCP